MIAESPKLHKAGHARKAVVTHCCCAECADASKSLGVLCASHLVAELAAVLHREPLNAPRLARLVIHSAAASEVGAATVLHSAVRVCIKVLGYTAQWLLGHHSQHHAAHTIRITCVLLAGRCCACQWPPCSAAVGCAAAAVW
jgi:hypothetical protein